MWIRTRRISFSEFTLWVLFNRGLLRSISLIRNGCSFLDISYSGVHSNKKFPTVEGPEVVRWGKGLTWLGLGVEASRKFYFGILNFPVLERTEPAHMWIREQAQGSGNLFSDFKFSGDIFAGAKGLAGGLGGLGWKPGNSIFN